MINIFLELKRVFTRLTLFVTHALRTIGWMDQGIAISASYAEPANRFQLLPVHIIHEMVHNESYIVN